MRALVQATYSIRRLPIERKTSTCRRQSKTVSTVKKSQATIDSPCARRKLRHDCRSRPHRERVPGAARQHPAEGRQQHSVVRLEPRAPDLTAKNRQLVAEHENLQLLRSIASPDEHNQLQQATDDEVEG